MADIAKYRQDVERFNQSYAKEALKEPFNFWALAGFLAAAVFTGSVIPLLIALVAEAIYLVTVPNLPTYPRLVEERHQQKLLAAHIANREGLIKTFTPREREAVEYLRWLKNKIQENYRKFTGASRLPSNLQALDQRWEDFVDLLDTYRRRK